MAIAGKSGQYSVQVVDPTTPPKVVLTLPIPEFRPTGFIHDVSVDRSKRTAIYQGEPVALEVINRKLVKVPLARPGTPAAIQVSSINDACLVAGLVQTDASGTDAYVGVTTAGADNKCETFQDNETKIVLTSSGPTTAPSLTLPRGQSLLWTGSIGDAGGKLAWLIVNDSSVPGAGKLVAYSADLRTKFDVPGSEHTEVAYVDNLELMGPVLLSNGVYVWVEKTLRRMNADGAGLRLGAPLYTATGLYRPSRLSMDGTDAYFIDGRALMRLRADTVTAVATLAAAYDGSYFAGQTPSKLLTFDTNTSGATQIAVVDKSSGRVGTVVSSDINKPRTALGMANDTLYYFAGKHQDLGDLRKVQLDGLGDTQLETGVFSVDVVSIRAGRSDYSYGLDGVESVLYCKPSTGASDCRTGKLYQYDIATGKITSLGSFTGSTVPVWKFGVTFGDNSDTLITVNGASSADKENDLGQDLWLFTPGQANSLRRVTVNLP